MPGVAPRNNTAGVKEATSAAYLKGIKKYINEQQKKNPMKKIIRKNCQEKFPDSRVLKTPHRGR